MRVVASRDLADPRAVPSAADADDLTATAIRTIRGLCIDAVEAAGSGHPGLPLAMAPAAYLLYARIMAHDPADPGWPDRDRFVLSAGHGSALLYSILHLAGYDLPLEELRRFRQWGSATPGHPSAAPRPLVSRRPRDRWGRVSPTGSGWRWPSASCESATAPS